MIETIVSTKGAVVIPASLRKKLGISPGRKVAVFEIDGKLQIIPLSENPVASLRGCLKTHRTVEQLIHDTRKPDVEHENFLLPDSKDRKEK